MDGKSVDMLVDSGRTSTITGVSLMEMSCLLLGHQRIKVRLQRSHQCQCVVYNYVYHVVFKNAYDLCDNAVFEPGIEKGETHVSPS